jgi:hypothetical protein
MVLHEDLQLGGARKKAQPDLMDVFHFGDTAFSVAKRDFSCPGHLPCGKSGFGESFRRNQGKKSSEL